MGGSAYGLDSPIIKATIEINGVTATAGSGYSDAVQAFLGSSVANQQTHTTSDSLTFNFDSSVIGFGSVAFRAGGIATALDLTPAQLVYRFPAPDGPAPFPSRRPGPCS